MSSENNSIFTASNIQRNATLPRVDLYMFSLYFNLKNGISLDLILFKSQMKPLRVSTHICFIHLIEALPNEIENINVRGLNTFS